MRSCAGHSPRGACASPGEQPLVRRGAILLVAAALGSAGCDVRFNDSAYDRLCWADGSRCVKYLDAAAAFEVYAATTDLPIDDADVERWETTFERLDGVFDFIGTDSLSADEKAAQITFSLEHAELMRHLFRVVDSELRTVTPRLLARNSAERLALMRIAVAPFLQKTNGSVGVANGDQVAFLVGVDRLVFNVVERDGDETWARSVVSHELIHASHFASTAYATASRGLQRSLWVEGLATRGSANVAPTKFSLAGVVTPGYFVAYWVVAAAVEHAFDELLQFEPDAAYPLAREKLARIAQ